MDEIYSFDSIFHPPTIHHHIIKHKTKSLDVQIIHKLLLNHSIIR
jgi:hypothetical protein